MIVDSQTRSPASFDLLGWPPGAGRWLLALWCLVLFAVDRHVLESEGTPAELVLEVTASVPSLAQVYFDTGHGFTELGSVSHVIQTANAPQELIFALPAGVVSAVRYDPLTTAGSVRLESATIRAPADHRVLQSIDLAQVTPLNQIGQLSAGPGGLEIVTVPNSTDSQVLLPVHQADYAKPDPFDFAYRAIGLDVSLSLGALILALLAAWVGRRYAAALRPATSRLTAVWHGFDGCIAWLTRVEGVRIDRWVLWFYVCCGLTFGGMAAAGLHGSSIDCYSTLFPYSGVNAAPLLGKPRGIRTDEWAIQTPAFLNQAFHAPAYGAKTSSVGSNDAALLMSLPCRDFSQICRPEFWSFHLLPFDAAFAVYWQAKGFILLTGVFTLLLVLTEGAAGLSALGALWFFFSAHTQWAYSWPSMLPEMVGLFGWVIALTCYLTVGRNPYLLAAAAVLCAAGAVDFALCAYPPHQIPLVLLGVALMAAWFWTRTAAIFRREGAAARLLALLGCWVAVGLLLGAFYEEAKAAIQLAGDTVYPGRRICTGGSIALAEFISHFGDFWKGEVSFPPAEGNICEGAGYLWLAPATLLFVGRGARESLRGPRFAALVACWLTCGVIAAWMLLPIPAGVGHWLLLDHVPPYRCWPGLGLANVAAVIVFLSLGSGVEAAEPAPARPTRWPAYLGIFLTLATLLALMNTANQDFFTPIEVLAAALYAALLVICLLERWSAVFAAAVLTALIYANAGINPVNRGFDVIEKSRLFQAVHADPKLSRGSWLVYSHDFELAGFVASTGVSVLNSFKVLPNLKGLAVFDPEGKFLHSYNQSGHTVARPLPAGEPCRWENPDTGSIRWLISPLDPGLKILGVRYVLFDEAPDPALAAKLRPLSLGTPGLWAYALP